MLASAAARPPYRRRLFVAPVPRTVTYSGMVGSPRRRGDHRAPAPAGNDVDRRAQPGRVRKHLSARPRPTRPVHPLSPPVRSAVWWRRSRRTHLSAAPPALCRRIGSPRALRCRCRHRGACRPLPSSRCARRVGRRREDGAASARARGHGGRLGGTAWRSWRRRRGISRKDGG